MSTSLKGPFTLPTDEVLSKATSSLPPDFVDHLRNVFDKLDTQNNGYIRISDLESYWKSHYNLDSSVTNSPIIKRLNEIAPCDMGLVSFPRLCTGVKEALLGSRKSHKHRKVSFLNALSTDEDMEETGEHRRRGSRDLIGPRNGGGGGGGGGGGNGVIDENNNVNVYGFSPPSSPRSRRRSRCSSGEVKLGLGGLKFTTSNHNNSNKTTSNHNINHNTNQNSNHNSNHIYKPRTVSPHNVESHQLLNAGLRTLSQIKTWYTRTNTQLYNGQLSSLPPQDVGKLQHLNQSLLEVLTQQHDQDFTPIPNQDKEDHAEEMKGLKERVATLEGEKSVLIRELFQLKAQIKSPNDKLRMASV